MPVRKLDFGAFDQVDYSLIAIHTLIEDYRLAFLINKIFSISLSKTKDELCLNSKGGETTFSRYNFYDSKKAVSWDLIQNKKEIVYQNEDVSANLFSETPIMASTKIYLLPELKKVDYFLKIENSPDYIKITEVTALLNTIDNITTAYKVDSNSIKSKNNLTF